MLNILGITSTPRPCDTVTGDSSCQGTQARFAESFQVTVMSRSSWLAGAAAAQRQAGHCDRRLGQAVTRARHWRSQLEPWPVAAGCQSEWPSLSHSPGRHKGPPAGRPGCRGRDRRGRAAIRDRHGDCDSMTV
jgi:hypothetical protein